MLHCPYCGGVVIYIDDRKCKHCNKEFVVVGNCYGIVRLLKKDDEELHQL